MMQRRIWDISPTVKDASPVFPGDTPYEQHWHATLGSDGPVNVASIRLSPHTGAHADAPLHYKRQGLPVGQLNLEAFIGPCRVIHCMGVRPLVRWMHVAHAMHKPLPERILLRTYTQMPQDLFDRNLAGIAPEVIEQFAQHGVRLIGTDSASIDPSNSQALPSHQAIAARDMRVLENLCLDEIDEGDYELIALPLKLMQADASPVRAILRSLT